MDELFTDFELWLGDSASLSMYRAVLAKSLDVNQELQLRQSVEDKTDKGSYLVQKEGSLGILRIAGPLLNIDNSLTRYFEMTTYPEIQNAAAELQMDSEIKAVILDIKSGGGAAVGVDTAAQALSKLRESKPVYTYTDNMMASGAYWLGVVADKVFASKLSQIGSIGAMSVHISVARAMKDFGLDVTVFRSTDLKAVGLPMENLSDEMKKEMQQSIDTWHNEFVGHVAAERGVPPMRVSTEWATGQVFFGTKALQLGLIDGIMTFNDLAQAVMSQHSSNRPLLQKAL